jgi:hypothetical protein
MNDVANRISSGLGDLPMLFADALGVDPRYYACARSTW